VFYTIERFHHAGGLAKPIAKLAVIMPETKTKSFIFFPSRSSPLLNRRRLKKQLNKITNYQKSPCREIYKGFFYSCLCKLKSLQLLEGGHPIS
jgi:hypothetical protein